MMYRAKAQMRFILSIVSFFLMAVVFKANAQLITSPVKIPSAHPRLFILPDQIAGLKSKINRPEFQAMKSKVYNLNTPACLAFRYLMDNTSAHGRDALNMAYNQLKSIKEYDKNRPPFKTLFNAVVAYDYCYDLFSSGGVPSKNAFLAEIKRVSALGPGDKSFAPVDDNFPTLVGHFVEGVFYNQVLAGIAIYGDDNSLYNSAMDFLLKRIQTENKFWFASHMHHQGGYIGTRQSHIVLTALAFQTLSRGKDLFSQDLQYIPYHLLYFMRPDHQLMRIGDVSDDHGRLEYVGFVCRQTANYFNDPYLHWLSERNIFKSYVEEIETNFFDLIYRPINVETRSIDNLPLTKYFPEPVGGDMVARTGWDLSGPSSSTAIVHMRIGNYYFGNHQHKDFGTFQIYYKGNLTGDAGMYQGSNSKASSDFWINYYRSTIAHNGLLIVDPNEKYSGGNWTNTAVDGGMRWPLNDDVQPNNLDELLDRKNGYQYAKVIGHDFGPDLIKPDFSYISGDLTAGYVYDNGLNSDKVKKVTRSMVTVNGENTDFPCFFVVFDRIEATDPSFKKVFLMHSMYEPSRSGNLTTIAQGGAQNGKLGSYTLLPEKPNYNIVEGYKINGKEYNPGSKSNSAYEDLKWRLEISPSEKRLDDEFLHAMVVMDGNQTPPTPEKIINENLVGAKILDKVVMFDRKGSTLAQATFELEGDQLYSVLICDILPGNWMVEKDGENFGVFNISKNSEKRNIYFKGTEGTYSITNLSYLTTESSPEN